MVVIQEQMKSESELNVRNVPDSALFVLEQPLSHTQPPEPLKLISPQEQEESISSGVESGASSWDRSVSDVKGQSGASSWDRSVSDVKGQSGASSWDRSVSDVKGQSGASSWDRSVSDVKGQSLARLQDDLRKAHDELRLKDEQVSRLTRIRAEVEAELEELTASLFQEAHSMVREANVRQAGAEKSLKESLMQIEVLTAEVAALKALVLTSTPSRPNPHLHPQIKDESGGLLRKHRRSPSHLNLNYGRQTSPPKSPTNQPKNCPDSPQPKDDAVEVDPIVHKEFLAWKENPTLDKSDPFIARIYREDIETCLLFANKELSKQLSDGIQMGEIFIEAVSDKAKNNFPRKCALLETVRRCQYRLRIGNSETWHSISYMCRNRIIAVCDFLNYLRYIQRGLVKSSAHEIYWEIVRLRKEMVVARLGLALSS